MLANAPFLPVLLGLALFAIMACEGPMSKAAPPMQFLGAKTELIAVDMVDITVSAARPTKGAMKAYADCVGSQYAAIRGMNYARRVTSSRTGQGDILTDKVTFLISSVAPSGDFVLNANQVVSKCKRAGVPTV